MSKDTPVFFFIYMKVYCSLTSTFQNQNLLLQALKSLLSQTLYFDKCFIFLSEDDWCFRLLDKTPVVRRNGFPNKAITCVPLKNFLEKYSDQFEVKWVKNTGPFRKFLPILKEKFNEDCLIITLDDDQIYNDNLIKNYVECYILKKCCVSFRSFRVLNFLNSKFYYPKNQDFRKKQSIANDTKHFFNFSTGVAGTLYKPEFFKKTESIIFDEGLYNSCCPTADDQWFFFCRLANEVEMYSKIFNFRIKDITDYKNCLYCSYNNNIDTQSLKLTFDLFKKMGLLKKYLFI